ncbi:unnamed protein product [Boreogadus saida]
MKTIAGLQDLPPFSSRARPPPTHPEPALHLLTQRQPSTSSPRASPPPPHPEPALHLLTQTQTSTSCQKSSRTGQCSGLKGETERLGTGLWCQDGPETEAGDQGPAAPDQRTRNPWLKGLMEEPC